MDGVFFPLFLLAAEVGESSGALAQSNRFPLVDGRSATYLRREIAFLTA